MLLQMEESMSPTKNQESTDLIFVSLCVCLYIDILFNYVHALLGGWLLKNRTSLQTLENKNSVAWK